MIIAPIAVLAVLAEVAGGAPTAGGITVSGRNVFLHDLAYVDELPADLRAQVRTRPVLQFASGRSRMVVTRHMLDSRVRALFPAVRNLRFRGTGPTVIVNRTRSAVRAREPDCIRLAISVRPGQPFTERIGQRLPCRDDLAAAVFRYDAWKNISYAMRAADVGDMVRAPGIGRENAVIPGDRVDMVAHRGVVGTRRPATALQAAWPDRPFFVRTGDGRVHRVTYEKDAE